jgi:hypothetical protein
MAEYTGTFETGVDGNNILTSDGGSANAWDDIEANGTTTLKYSNVQKYQTLAMQVVTDATPNTALVSWGESTLGTSITTIYGRLYLFLPSGHDQNVFVARGFGIGGALAWEIIILAAGNILLRDNTGASSATGAVNVSMNQWIRIEFKMVSSPTVGQLEAKLFNTADSSSPDETITSAANQNTLTRTDRVRFGVTVQGKASSTYYFDNILVNDTAYPGPVVTATANLAPVIYGRGAA